MIYCAISVSRFTTRKFGPFVKFNCGARSAVFLRRLASQSSLYHQNHYWIYFDEEFMMYNGDVWFNLQDTVAVHLVEPSFAPLFLFYYLESSRIQKSIGKLMRSVRQYVRVRPYGGPRFRNTKKVAEQAIGLGKCRNGGRTRKPRWNLQIAHLLSVPLSGKFQ